MDTEELKIKIGEVYIDQEGYSKIPLFPKAFDKSIKYDFYLPNLAYRAAAETYNERLAERRNDVIASERKQVEEYISMKATVVEDGPFMSLRPHGFGCYVQHRSNGLAAQIGTGSGSSGALYIPGNDSERVKLLSKRWFRVSSEKLAKYSVKDVPEEGVGGLDIVEAIVWTHHNKLNYGSSFFVANWAVEYNNMLIDYLAKIGKL